MNMVQIQVAGIIKSVAKKRRGNRVAEAQNPKLREVVKVMRTRPSGETTITAIAEAMGISRHTVMGYMRALRASGRVILTGTGNSRRWRLIE
jgi:biotin operon repressor